MLSSMPPNVWYVIVLGVVVVVGLALWLNRRLKITKGSITVGNGRESGSAGISVASGARITGSTTGDITGVSIKGSGAPPAAPKGGVDVLRNAEVTDSKVGDISGVAQDQRKGDKP